MDKVMLGEFIETLKFLEKQYAEEHGEDAAYEVNVKFLMQPNYPMVHEMGDLQIVDGTLYLAESDYKGNEYAPSNVTDEFGW